MKRFFDSLYEHFERHLHKIEESDRSQYEFVTQVVEEYYLELVRGGFVSGQHETEIREDLEAEVIEMLQKKTYGHFSINSYREFYQRERNAPISVSREIHSGQGLGSVV